MECFDSAVPAIFLSYAPTFFIQTWSNDMVNSSKGKIYRTFELDFGCEQYLEKQPPEFRTILLKFRTTNHRLPVETGSCITTDPVYYVTHQKLQMNFTTY